MSDVFLSYSHQDTQFVELLQNKLEQAGLSVWRDNAINLGTHWREEIDRSIQDASSVVVVMTPRAVKSPYVNYELAFAWGAGIRIIPVLLKEAKRDPHLEALEYLNFTDHKARPWNTLIKFLQRQKDLKANGIPLIRHVHGYSGAWHISTKFFRWQEHKVYKTDRVEFEGTMFLLLSPDGKSGHGSMTGELNTCINYRDPQTGKPNPHLAPWMATYRVANEVKDAHVDPEGCLHLTVQVLSRLRIDGEKPPQPYSDRLFGKKEFEVTLRPAANSFRTLKGEHEYLTGYRQAARETYTYKGPFGTECKDG